VVDLMAGDEHAHEGHDHDGPDPHFWLDPLLVADLGDAVADRLGEIDPDHREDYLANAAELRGELKQLDAAYAAGLADCERDTVVVSHDAFGYLERYGLHLEPIAGLSPGAEPTPAHLARLQELAVEEGITTVFAETLGSHKMADALAGDLGLRTLTLDPIEGVDTDGSEDYVSLMRSNLENLEVANGC
jgi:zinc transport system substrate-binding protein